jgi:hypothetical protein
MKVEATMMRKLSITVLLVLMAAFFAAIPVQAEKSYYAERFDVYIDIQEDGSAIITETVDFDFEGDPFTFAFREISAEETDGLTFLDASMDGVPMPPGTQAGQVEVEPGNPLKVTWHFQPTSGSTHSFTVRYRADGVIRKGDADTLIWRAVPDDHDYAISSSTITLTYPASAKLLAPPSLNRDFESSSDGNRIVLTHGGLAEDEDLILTARFSPGSLTSTIPQWQGRAERTDAAVAQSLPVGFLAGLITLVFGGLGILQLARANGRDLTLGPVIPRANPPSDLAPAVVGKLTGQSHTFMGAIFDLAERGVLEVEQEKSRWGMKNHVLVQKDPGLAWKPFEQRLLDALFKPGSTRVNMNEAGTRLAMKSKLLDESLEQELVQRGWLDPERKTKRTWYSMFGLALMILSTIVFLLSVAGGGISFTQSPGWLPWVAILAGISVGVFIVSIPLLVYGATFSVLNSTGEQQSVLWKGFGEYLRRVSKGKEPAIGPDYFEKYLAYAAVFGVAKEWARHFQGIGGVSLPVWFHTMDGLDGDFSAMVAVMAASDTAGAGADGGGGGASGGGSSGAG